MFRRALFFSFFFFLSLQTSLAGTGQFCVQTFNVYGPAYASSVGQRIQELGDELLRDPCDSVQFQEFWRDKHYSPFTKQMAPARLAFVRADEFRADKAMTGLASAFSGSVLSAQAELFRVNNESGVLDWFRDLTGVQKGYSLLEVKLDRAPAALFANLHTHPTDEAIRIAQITQLMEAALLHPKAGLLPFILTGDLNATPESPELALLQDVLGLRDTFPEANGAYGNVCTYCADNRYSWSRENRVIDFVMVRNSLGNELRVARSEINLKGEPYWPLSDHYGVRSFLQWNEREESLLDLRSALAQTRLKKAIASLQRARGILAKKRGKGFQDAARLLGGWEKSILEGNLAGNLKQALLTP